jgi:hypothetical protein
MSVVQALAVATIIVPASTAFLVAYWHRKQLRQIEAYRLDPSVGLTPPPSALWKFVTSRRRLLALAGIPVVIIALAFYFRMPVTLTTVLLVAFNVASIAVALLLDVIEGIVRVLGRVVEALATQTETQAKHVVLTAKVADIALLTKGPPSPGS